MRSRLNFSATLESPELAKVARLRYVCDADAGYSRRRNGKGFVYLDARGAPIKDPRKIKRIESLVIPPAWRDVWICPTSNGHLQATGRDARQRKQYLYHERWQRISNLAKFLRMEQFGVLLPKLRQKIARQISAQELTRERVLAGMVALLDLTAIRIGNEEYVKENGSYGLTTLRDRHVVETSAGVELRFRAKGGFRRNVLIEDKQLARFVKACAALKGARLFQCIECDEVLRPVQSADVNEYLQSLAGEAITAKDFRTWKASALAAGQLFAAIDRSAKTARKRTIRETVCGAAELLSNTPTVCRNYYIHPGLLESYENGAFARHFEGFSPRRSKLYTPEEQILRRFLDRWKPAVDAPEATGVVITSGAA
jgi:DNA topoisomerase-1